MTAPKLDSQSHCIQMTYKQSTPIILTSDDDVKKRITANQEQTRKQIGRLSSVVCAMTAYIMSDMFSSASYCASVTSTMSGQANCYLGVSCVAFTAGWYGGSFVANKIADKIFGPLRPETSVLFLANHK